MSNKNLFMADVQFDVCGKTVKFQVVHNLPELNGLSFNSALDNWLSRTKKYTAKSLCKYVMDKQNEYVCMTIDQWNQLNN